MNQYELTATLSKLKRNYGKDLGSYIVNNAIQAEATRCRLTSDPNQILAQLKVINGHEGFEAWNSYLFGDFLKNQGSDLKSNQPNLVAENDERTMRSNSKIATPEDSVQIDLSKLGEDYSTDEVFAGLEPLSEVKGNRFGELFDDWVSVEGLIRDQEIPNFCRNSSDELNLKDIDGGFSMMNLSRKGSRTDYEGFDFVTQFLCRLSGRIDSSADPLNIWVGPIF